MPVEGRTIGHTPYLIVGAGPFGLSAAAYARDAGLEHVVLGSPMSFWREHMPAGMFLRSDTGWHLDPSGECTMSAWMEARDVPRSHVEPLGLERYLDYVEWFRGRKRIEVVRDRVVELRRSTGPGRLAALLESGGWMLADNVLLAPGFAPFRRRPEDLLRRLEPCPVSHARDAVDLAGRRGCRVLIVGGRQSALEWAALLAEAGATAVHVSHRHPTPAFEEADWSWVGPLVDGMIDHPGWWRELHDDERESLEGRLWAEGAAQGGAMARPEAPASRRPTPPRHRGRRVRARIRGRIPGGVERRPHDRGR